MRIYNATKSTMNLPLANGSRLIIRPQECSKQFYPTVDMLTLLVSAYSYDDIAIIIDSAAEISMGATVSALPGFVANSLEEAIMKFKKPTESKAAQSASVKPTEVKPAKTTVVEASKPKVSEVKPQPVTANPVQTGTESVKK